MLWLCLRFPLLALEGFVDSKDQQPAAVTEKHRILLGNASAAAIGIKPGITLATAQALCPEIRIFNRNTEREALALQALAYGCYCFTPTVSSAPPDCLLLEIGGCLTLFKGLDRLLARLTNTIRELGHYCVTGLAPTPKAAMLFSRTASNLLPLFAHDTGELRDIELFEHHLHALPLASLDCPKQLKDKFRATGFSCLGDLLNIPKAALGQRYGENFIAYLQQLTGALPDPQSSLELPAEFHNELFFNSSVNSADMLVFPMQRLLQALTAYLHGRQMHCSSMQWQIQLVGGKTADFTLHLTRPQNNFAHFLSLSRLQLENHTLPAPAEGLALHVTHLHPAEHQHSDLFGQQAGAEAPGDITPVLDKLRTRLGPDAIHGLRSANSHIPEQAWQLTDMTAKPSAVSSGTSNTIYRPLWLLQNPEPIRIKHQRLYWRGELELQQGPERIEGNWWQQAVCRDYFVARHRNGAQYWIYHDRLATRWFVHGAFA